MFRRGWNCVDAKLIDQRYLSGGAAEATDNQPHHELWQYVIEIPGAYGGAVRLAITEKSYKLRLPPVGGEVPVLVNPKRTEAVFDPSDPRIDAVRALNAERKAEKERDEARFEEVLSDQAGSGAFEATEEAESGGASTGSHRRYRRGRCSRGDGCRRARSRGSAAEEPGRLGTQLSGLTRKPTPPWPR